MPTICVIVPVYNVEEYIHRCVDSILSQSFSDFELLLVDDGSTDSSGDICDEYANMDKRVRVFHQKNQGQAIARNTGLDYLYEHSDSRWIAFIDSDDYVHPKYLEILLDAVKATNLRISACKLTNDTIDDCSVKFPQYTVLETERFFCDYNTIAVVPVVKLFHRECFTNVRFPQLMMCEDEAIIFKALFHYANIAFINSSLYYYYLNPLGTMLSDWTPKRLAAIDAIEQQIAYFKENDYKQALRTSVFNLLWTYSNYISIIKDKKEYKSLRKNLKKTLKDLLKKYEDELSFSKFKQGIFYESAYPFEMKIYWTLFGVYSKFKRK